MLYITPLFLFWLIYLLPILPLGVSGTLDSEGPVVGS